ncbi:TadE/TadG family type IV pilus assembly protein [Streptomyces sp. NPDC051561]|uniref:TadE/TadG family type IV pilus assembly protein n=1 Tax=Streptomyces sp. NPDC051561 TaxID=3365658 RepID=UPI00378A18E4
MPNAPELALRASLRTRLRAMTGPDRDKGVAALEFAGFLPLLLLIAVAALQLGLVGYAASQAGSAARAAARVESQEDTRGQCQAAARESMSGWLANRTDVTCFGGDVVTATATVTVPALIPVFDVATITKSVSMPSDD